MIQTDTILGPKELLEVLRNQERAEFKALLRTQPEPVVDAAFEEANFEERLEFLRLMPVERAAHGFTDLPMPEQVAVIAALAPDRIRVMGAYIGPDEIADLLQEIDDPTTREHLLNALPKTLAASALELLQYNQDDAGGMMTPEFVALKEGWTAQHALSLNLQRGCDGLSRSGARVNYMHRSPSPGDSGDKGAVPITASSERPATQVRRSSRRARLPLS